MREQTTAAHTRTVLIGASLPRSGHHFLERLLARLFGPRLHYCEWYTPPGCCRAIPCTRGGPGAVVFQKNHDWQSDMPQDRPAALHVVQFRHPVPQALSDRELVLADLPGRAGRPHRHSAEEHLAWLAFHADYVRRFHDRWAASGPPNAFRLPYERLQADPAAALAGLCAAAGLRVPAEAIATAAETTRDRKPVGLRRTWQDHAPRELATSRAFDPELHGAYEAWLLPRVPAFGYDRLLPAGRYEGHPLHGLLLLADATAPLPPGCTDRLDTARALAGPHPLIEMQFAERDLAAGDPAAAWRRLADAAARWPFWAPLWPALLQVAPLAGETLPADLITPDALLTLTGAPETLPALAERLCAEDRPTEAVAAAALALAFLPEDAAAARAAAHRARAEAWTLLSRPDRAAADTAAAARLHPAGAGPALATA
ncbi:MAG: sulfotransferase [Acetobacteraceae bacterium]